MIDDIYKNAFKEVFDILLNTDEELVQKIPEKFMNFITSNMNANYTTTFEEDLTIDKQHLLPETEAVLSLIYRSYWSTQEEKLEFSKKDREERILEEQQKKENFKGKNIDEIFASKTNINKVTIDNNLMVIKKEGFFKKLFSKIFNIFKKDM